jgi:hypothetical protein
MHCVDSDFGGIRGKGVHEYMRKGHNATLHRLLHTTYDMKVYFLSTNTL